MYRVNMFTKGFWHIQQQCLDLDYPPVRANSNPFLRHRKKV